MYTCYMLMFYDPIKKNHYQSHLIVNATIVKKSLSLAGNETNTDKIIKIIKLFAVNA
jgi:predicted oxidoreductase